MRAAHAVLAATVPLTIPSNAWDFPMQAFLVAGISAVSCLVAQGDRVEASLAGGAVAAILIYPFLVRFAPHAGALHNAMRLVPRGLHTPSFAGLLVFYPLLAILALNTFFGERSKESSAFCMIWLVLLAAVGIRVRRRSL